MEPIAIISTIVSLIISIISIIFVIITFATNRKDKAIKDAKESNYELITYRLDKVDEMLEKILDKVENSTDDMRKIAQEELDKHILKYHKK